MAQIMQKLSPERILFVAGEHVTFTLSHAPGPERGHAVVRTNLGFAAVHRAELVRRTELQEPPPGLDWHDIPMKSMGGGVYRLTLPLPEVGTFEAKCCFIPSDGSAVLWPQGENYRLKVDPPDAAAGNTIYCAFVRQFGGAETMAAAPEFSPDVEHLQKEGYSVIPPSGTFRNVIRRLDHIFTDLGCRILQLLPIHPVPVLYGRMGHYGSPFAATDYFAVNPALAEFDTSATPMEQFLELVDAVHARNGRLFMDIPVNHTGWASKLQNEHPDYFVRREDGTFESPGAWGVVWADLCKLDYQVPKVQQIMAKVFLFWCRRGVDGFRCDAGYMLPPTAWEYIVSRVRTEYPDTVFLLEGLGGPPEQQEKLLGSCGLNWGYSELFQNYSRDEITRYYPYMEYVSSHFGTLVNFAETHDNNRLAASGKTYAKLRFLVNALLSQHGSFGFANGAEFYATEKIDVHGCGGLNFDAEPNLVPLIRCLTKLLANHPAFGYAAHVTLIQRGGGNVIAALRSGPEMPQLLVLLNLDCEHASEVEFPEENLPAGGTDLLSGRVISFRRSGSSFFVKLARGEGLCIGFEPFVEPAPTREPPAASARRADVMAQRTALCRADLARAASVTGTELLEDPEAFVSSLTGITPAPVTYWHYPQDSRRTVMIPPEEVLIIDSDVPFRAHFERDGRTFFPISSLKSVKGKYFALLCPDHVPEKYPELLTLRICGFEGKKAYHRTANMLLLPPGDTHQVRFAFAGEESRYHYAFGSNEFASYSLFPADWGKLYSKYDALLAVNSESRYPADRRVLFTRCRAWLVADDYSQELTGDKLNCFTGSSANRAQWRFLLPNGQGGLTPLFVDEAFASGGNAVRFTFRRPAAESSSQRPCRLILRPEVENRVNHDVTRAFTGPERAFPAAVRPCGNGFDFYDLSLRCDNGSFRSSPEWHYMQDLPLERLYGLSDKTDLFSPGFFECPLPPGTSVTLTACAGPQEHVHFPEGNALRKTMHPAEFAAEAMRHYIARRDDLATVIAGYPWFLDWGRDTLIALRGLAVRKEFREAAKAILCRFAAFERSGTIPNMIQGGNDSNRDTSDAPLYLILGARDLMQYMGKELLETSCGGRPLRTVLASIVEYYQKGTPNGIVMDPDSKLIFSPSHFTWMDTNFPAGTPREGYPIEIQALWYAALRFLGHDALADEVSSSVEKLYFRQGDFCSDCLHAKRGTPAAKAVADDHIRCNAIFALTLGAVRSPKLRSVILRSCSELLVPGAIRTLSDRPVQYPLPVTLNGRLLNDPDNPYRGFYRGPEDTERKVAYHNGTAWPWPFPSYCEALALEGGESAKKRALSLLLSVAEIFTSGVPGQVSEVLDGDAPHRAGGCIAQAWSVTEFFRVYEMLAR